MTVWVVIPVIGMMCWGCGDSFGCGNCLVAVLVVSVVVLEVVMMNWGCGGISVVVITG